MMYIVNYKLTITTKISTAPMMYTVTINYYH